MEERLLKNETNKTEGVNNSKERVKVGLAIIIVMMLEGDVCISPRPWHTKSTSEDPLSTQRERDLSQTARGRTITTRRAEKREI